MKPTKITSIITIGDSLSDRGTFFRRNLFGCIPVKNLLHHVLPKGRFTNGFVWGDYIGAMMANELLIRELKEEFHWDSTDIADAVIHHSFPEKYSLEHAYTLSDDELIAFNGKNIMRNYNEAGLTAHNYHGEPSSSPTSSIYRNLVSTLDYMRQKLLAYDKANSVSSQQKKETLVIEWSGANDLLIANTSPSKEIVDKAIQARIENLKCLIKQGYRHFVLFNLPDLFFTPRYQKKSEQERDNAHECSVYFNTKLSAACKELAALNPDCSIEEFDVNSVFAQGYQNPEKYGLDKEKLKLQYAELDDSTNPSAKGYTFWDDLHFTAYIHALVAEKLYSKIRQKFYFSKSDTIKDKAQAAPSQLASKATLLKGLLATVAAVIGLNKLGISAKTATVGLGVGLSLATIGMFAKKPICNFFIRPEHAPVVLKDCHMER